jgi:DNA-directed RNA polymerase sigma subunit (sigma70/sigma32)
LKSLDWLRRNRRLASLNARHFDEINAGHFNVVKIPPKVSILCYTHQKQNKMKIENMDDFLREIGRVELLSAEEELELLKAVKEKGPDSDELEQLCWAEMRFVVHLASQYQNRGLPLEELIGVGAEGLKKAALTYDFDNNPKFIQYAVSVMRQSLEEAIAK